MAPSIVNDGLNPANGQEKTADEDFYEDFYEVLGVGKDVHKSELRKAYSKLVLKEHPDRGGDPAKFDRIQAAYETLIDPRQRRTYNKYGEKWLDAKSEDFLVRAFTGVEMVDDKVLNTNQTFKTMERRNAELEKKVILYENAKEETHSSGFESWLRNRKEGMNVSVNSSNLLEKLPGVAVIGDKIPLPDVQVSSVMLPSERGGSITIVSDKLPGTLRANEVFVRWLATPVTPADIESSRRAHSQSTVGGLCGVGFAEKVGAAVSNIPPGSIVVPRLVFGNGTFRAMSVVRHDKLHSLGATEAKDDILAFLPVFCQAYQLLNVEVLKPGDYILQTDALTPVGQAIIQMAKVLRIGTINLIPDNEMFDEMKDNLLTLGATHVLRSTATAARDISVLGSPEPRLCLGNADSVGVSAMFDAVRPDNTVCIYGDVLGALEELSIPTAKLIARGIKLTGFSFSTWCDQNRADFTNIVDVVLAMIEEERLTMLYEAYHHDPYDSSLKQPFNEAFHRAKGNVTGMCTPALLVHATRDEVKDAADKGAAKDAARQHVYNWLDEINMVDLAQKFFSAGYTDIGSITEMGLTDEDMDYIGITPPVIRRRLMAHAPAKQVSEQRQEQQGSELGQEQQEQQASEPAQEQQASEAEQGQEQQASELGQEQEAPNAEPNQDLDAEEEGAVHSADVDN